MRKWRRFLKKIALCNRNKSEFKGRTLVGKPPQKKNKQLNLVTTGDVLSFVQRRQVHVKPSPRVCLFLVDTV